MRRQLLTLALLILSACLSTSTVPGAIPAASLGPTPSLDGSWQLTLRDTLRARRAMGRLVLRATAERDTFTVYPASERSGWFMRSPYEGYAQIDLAEAGAVTSLDPESRSPVYPGVVLEVAFVRSGSNMHRNAKLVFGGTRRDGIVQTDGPSLEMLITRWTAESMSGTWESTACACTPSAAGYFLVRRQR